MLHNFDTAPGVVANSSPGLLYAAWVYLVGLPIEKWVSGLTAMFILLQMAFLVRDRVTKRRTRRGRQ